MLQTSISQQTGFGHLTDLPCIKLQYGNASAVVSLYGGQVLSYQPTPGHELLWLSPLASWHNQTPIRGGVPVCWPWFGRFGWPGRFSGALVPGVFWLCRGQGCGHGGGGGGGCQRQLGAGGGAQLCHRVVFFTLRVFGFDGRRRVCPRFLLVW